MGWNTTVVVMNDSLHMIEQDPTFGQNLVRAIRGRSLTGVLRTESFVPAYSYKDGQRSGGVDCNAAEVIETHHADGYAICAIGGNTGVKLGECYYTGFPNKDESKLKVLQQLADDLGYRLVKKAKKVA